MKTIINYTRIFGILFITLISIQLTADNDQNKNRDNELVLSSLPLQINFDNGKSVTYEFDKPITSVLSRNLNVVDISIDGHHVTFTALNPGRTGLRIVSEEQDYYMGLRINKDDGKFPGMPNYLSVGSVSVDSPNDLAFWEGVSEGKENKSMDIRYIYLNGGPIGGWATWGTRVETFCNNSLKYGLIPFFVFYNIPDNQEGYAIDNQHVNDVNYMTAYFNNLNLFMSQANNVMQGELYGIVLEPDFLGYMQQNAKPNNPDVITTCVSETSIAEGAGTLETLVKRINSTINNKRSEGHNIFYGWQLNLWAYEVYGMPHGVIRATDTQGFDKGRATIQNAATQTALYAIKAGALSNKSNFLSIDKYGLDAMGYQNKPNPANSTWFFNNDHWLNYLYYAQTIHLTSKFPVILWQLPIGHINVSQTISAYTGSPFSPLPNTNQKFEDSTPTFFLGDKFIAETPERLSYFSENLYNDASLRVSGDTITWGVHMQNTKESGIISSLFGAGVAASTTGIGDPPTDDYFWIQKVQNYYLNGAIELDWSMFNICNDTCAPTLTITYPRNNEKIILSELSVIDISILAWDQDGHLTSLKLEIDGQTHSFEPTGYTYTYSWTPPSFGTYSATISATDSDGESSEVSVSFSVEKFNPESCGVPLWDKKKVYGNKGTKVAWNGNIYENLWWTQGNEPGKACSCAKPWKYISACPSASNQSSNGNNDNLIVSIYPNPAERMANISFYLTNEARVTVMIYNLMGERKIEIPLQLLNSGNHVLNVDLSNMRKGLYSVKMIVNNTVVTSKLVIN